ncbi:MAG: alpha/beta-hydrolase family protein [Candidatus Saccharimonadales bacterium]|nr:alpha/beta-hydrolase family protein [Candidatus Saccharimonadales bacterium]
MKEFYRGLSKPGIVVGLLLYSESLSPSLLPRSTLTQAIMSGLFMSIGYGIGAIGGYINRKYIATRFQGYEIPEGPVLLLVVALALIVTFERVSYQEAQAAVLGIDSSGPNPFMVIIGMLAIGSFFLTIGRTIRRVSHWVRMHLHKRATKALAFTGSWLVVGVLIYFFFSSSLFLLGLALEGYSDFGTNRYSQPKTSLRSGGPGSLVNWDNLDIKGRRFVTSGPSVQDIADLTGQPASEPIRVYGSLNQESSVEARVQLVLDELERTGAYDRSHIVLFTPSGTGWVNETAVDSVEYLLGGDVASAALQYSNISSFLQYVVDRDVAETSSSLMTEKLAERLQQIAEPERPRLVVYGESLGSMGSQSFFVDKNIDDFDDYIDGAVWVGSPSASRLWTELRAGADKTNGAPIVGEGEIVRFGTSSMEMTSLKTNWGDTRIALLYNNTDPVVWYSAQLAFTQPEWLMPPYPEGISDRMRWKPLLTMTQIIIELGPSGSMPSGVGHTYDEEIPRVFAEVLQGGAWGKFQTDQLVDTVLGRQF